MPENGIKVIRIRKDKATTDSDHRFNIAPNLLDQDFTADGPNQKWAGDIGHIWTSEGWLYLAVILDLYSRCVIGRAVRNRMKRDLAIRALDMAVALRQAPEGCIHHTDRGSQYCSNEYQRRLSRHGFRVCRGKGNCYDSSMVERRMFSRTDGVLMLHLQIHQGRADLAKSLGHRVPGRSRAISVYQWLL